ncbi:MAG: hypothetical protein D6719_07340 [Candidatus Dadabacteria bacterium]|nr:MAG: hypothetical protein D6719_07340 [Candidatus Dadabacteria bacterium]
MSTAAKTKANEPVGKSFTLSRSLRIDQISWDAVSEILNSKYNIPPEKSVRLIKEFQDTFSHLFEIEWYKKDRLKGDLHALAAAICEAHKTDTVTVYIERRGKLMGIEFYYRQRVKFLPNADAKGEGMCLALTDVKAFGLSYSFEDFIQIASMRLLMIMTGVAAYVVIVGTALYCVSAYLLFEQMPREMIIESVRTPKIGIALIIMFVAMAAVISKLISLTFSGLSKLLSKS